MNYGSRKEAIKKHLSLPACVFFSPADQEIIYLCIKCAVWFHFNVAVILLDRSPGTRAVTGPI